MTMNEIRKRWESFAECDKSLYIEYVCFCNFASDEDFYYHLHPEEANEAQFLSVLDFLYHQDCYVLLHRFLRDNIGRLIYPDFNLIEGMDLRKDLEKRFEQYCFWSVGL